MSCESVLDQIRFQLEDQKPLTACEMLHLIELALAKIRYGITTGESVTYLEIRNRRVQFSNTNQTIEQLERDKHRYEDQCASESRNIQRRNIGTFKRL